MRRLLFATLVALLSQNLMAQATRTWVSGVGDDANPCSRTAPCKTFAGAISKTANGGEIDALDPGGFGAVTITKSLTIDGQGVVAGIAAPGTTGIIINATAADKIVLRNIEINGFLSNVAGQQGNPLGINGINILSASQVTIDNVRIQGFGTTCVRAALTAAGELNIVNSYLTECATGVSLTTSAGQLLASIDRTSVINSTAFGVDALTSSTGQTLVAISRSTIAHNNGGGVRTQVTASMSVDNSVLAFNNGFAANALAGTTIRLANNLINNNANTFNTGGGVFLSTGDNRVEANGGGVPPFPAAYTVR